MHDKQLMLWFAKKGNVYKLTIGDSNIDITDIINQIEPFHIF